MKGKFKIIIGSIVLSLSLSSSIVSAETINQNESIDNLQINTNEIITTNYESPYWSAYWSASYDIDRFLTLGYVTGETRYRFLVTDGKKGVDYKIHLDKYSAFSDAWYSIESTKIESSGPGEGLSKSWTWSDLDKNERYRVRVEGKAKGKIEVFKYK
ncbi:hypothetical protein [Paenibacillus silvae]|uniref:Uncharacterized protein n=1 Tax=Paenibacillus silvae TaxID=1325358 RepID=A0A2W6P353_9BACL|nr:hypothetical protein [Paenibacillus silvae]PZT54110.1 hypothetical protein DN757_18950 [Paenibacillus silvae]